MDIYGLNDEDSWKYIKREKNKDLQRNFKEEILIESGQYFEDYADIFIHEFVSKKNRQPTLKEFKKDFPKFLKPNGITHAYVINPWFSSSKKWMKLVPEIILEKETDGVVTWDTEKSRLRLQNLKIYINVYKLHKKNSDGKRKTIKEIIMQVGAPSEKKAAKENNENIIRQYRRYKKKAERIIANTEDGVFPGKY